MYEVDYRRCCRPTRYPGWPLEMLIPINVDGVAKELSATAAH
jgi:hypothetical protein